MSYTVIPEMACLRCKGPIVVTKSGLCCTQCDAPIELLSRRELQRLKRTHPGRVMRYGGWQPQPKPEEPEC